MIDTYALLIGQVMTFLGGFLIGIGLKTILDCFVARDDMDVIKSRLNKIEDELEDLDEEVEGLGGDIDDLAKVVARHTEWIEEVEAPDTATGYDDVDVAADMLTADGD